MWIVVFVTYRPKPGQRDVLCGLLADHRAMLQSKGLINDAPDLLLQERDGEIIAEVFAWVDEAAAHRAHEDEEVMARWGALAEAAEMIPMADVPQAATPFAHFEPLDQG